MPPPPPWIVPRLAAYGYRPSRAAAAGLERYLELVAEGNARARLVGASDAEALVGRHLGESLYLGTLVELSGQRLVDLGSGAGFPGLALALGWPGLHTTLVEATGKKADFLRAAVQALGLGPRVAVAGEFVQPHAGAAGEAGAALARAELVTVRALERMEAVPGWLGRKLPPGARAAFWVTAPRAEQWRKDFPAWEWSPFHLLPESRERGIVLGRPPVFPVEQGGQPARRQPPRSRR